MSADAEAPPDKQVKDEDGKSQSAAIRRVQKLRDELADFGLSFAQNELDRQFSEADQMRAYYRLVRQTTQQLRGVLTDDDIPQSQHYWEECEIGTITVYPPQATIGGSVKDALQSDSNVALDWMRVEESLEPRQYAIVGLQQFLMIEEPEWQESWEVNLGLGADPAEIRRSLDNPAVTVEQGRGVGNYIVTKPARLERRIIDNAAAQLQAFTRELGLGITVDDEEQQTKIDRELLEEVDEWRKQNIDN